VAILDAGAYGAVMSSTYNARPQAAQVLVDARAADPAGFTLIRPRQTIETLWLDEILPERAGA
jgi:diaminopimelate decarboxylase